MVRTRNFDPGTALSRAMELFSTRGYSDTSMEEIVKATGVSRYGLYGTFGNKRELFEQALERFAEDMGRRGFLKLLEPDASLADVRALLVDRVNDLCDGGAAKGCLLCHTAMQLAPHDEEIRTVLQRFIRRASKTFSIGLETARARGEVRADLDTRSAGEFLTGTMFGLTVLARSGFGRDSLEAYVDNALAGLAA